MNTKFKITQNTDGTDIQDQCLGLSVSVPGKPELNKNRGLCIQIKHNKNKTVFGYAVELSRKLEAAPDMYEALELIKSIASESYRSKEEMQDAIQAYATRALNKARGAS